MLDPAVIPLSLYVHLPWCVRKCPYCDFNSHELAGAVPEDAYVAALLRDLDAELALGETRLLQTIFIGGGTPKSPWRPIPARSTKRISRATARPALTGYRSVCKACARRNSARWVASTRRAK